MVNGSRIGRIVTRRLDPGKPTDNDICRYEWSLTINGKTLTNLADAPVEHRFGDGAWALVAHVITEAGLAGVNGVNGADGSPDV
jgi:hypothetical protein